MYTTIGEVCEEVGLPHPPVIATLLRELFPLLPQASKDLRDVPVIQDVLRIINRGSKDNVRRVIELNRDLEENNMLGNGLQVEINATYTQI